MWIYFDKAGEQLTDAVSGATPLAVATLVEAGDSIEAALSGMGISFWKLLVGGYPGTIGGTSALLCFAGAGFLMLLGIASYRIVFGGVAGLLATGMVLNLFSGGGGSAWYSLNPLYHLVMGGFAFGIAYMATDPVSAPGMRPAQWVYGFCIGALTVLIRVFNPAFPEGIMLAILFMNLFSSFLDYLFIKNRLRKRIANV